ncbi:hypothetical protein ACIPT2_09845 [Pectobacterium brasiliense]|uniref:hypothetical protein n=1 Tax=Pectobacterium brasiliense TaxID=180957 RepID=UPI003819E2ED
MNQRTQWLGYHGTSVLNAGLIVKATFNVSKREKDWLGTGAYFFLESAGLKSPIEKAAEWANRRAKNAKPPYTSLSVLEAEIETETHLDLNDEMHIAALNTIRDEYIEIIKTAGKRPSEDGLLNKCTFCNYVMQEHGIDALVRREYIKTTDDEMELGFDGGVPNCRIICVKEPTASIRNVRYAVERRRIV